MFKILKISIFIIFLNINLFANIPEIDAIIYGKVEGKIGSLILPLNEGTLDWEIKDFENPEISYKFSTELTTFNSNNYSYYLKIPQQIFTSMSTLLDITDNTVILDKSVSEEVFLKHNLITVNGIQAQISYADIYFLLSEENRGLFKEVNLTIDLPFIDSDEDGLPDTWEEEFGFSDSNASDALIDSDFDGILNIDEYKYGSNPNVSNGTVLVLSENSDPNEQGAITIFEDGQTEIKNLKVFGLTKSIYPMEIKYIPSELNISLPNQRRNLNVGDLVYTDDVFIFSHNAILSKAINNKNYISVAIKDTDNNKNIDLNITYKIKNIKDIAEPHRWIDAKFSNNIKTDELVGRSGNEFDKLLLFKNNYGWSSVKSTEPKFNINSQNKMLDLNLKDENSKDSLEIIGLKQNLQPTKEPQLSTFGSLFVVFATNDPNQILFHDNSIEISLKDSFLNFAKTNQKGLNKTTEEVSLNETHIFSLENRDQYFEVFLDSLFVGGSKTFNSEYSTFKNSITSFGKINTYTAVPFDGELGEFIIFNDTLTYREKWLINSYLLSKWKNYTIIDYDQSNISNRLFAIEDYGNYTIIGGNSDDIIVGSKFDDILIGGSGNDTLTGKDGSDIFVVDNGDYVTDLTFEDSSLNKDILDISHLLTNTNENLYNCLFIEPVENKKALAKFKINKNCSATDTINGTDYNDYMFYVTTQNESISLNNSYISILWKNGVLQTGNHKPIETRASIQINKLQNLILSETNDEHYTVIIDFQTSEYFQQNGTKIFKIPLKINGTAIYNQDYQIFYNDINLSISPETGILYLPLNYEINQSQTVNFKLWIKEDDSKEEIESINIELMPVAEYYDIDLTKNKIEIDISNGLDRVSIERYGEQNITEGTQSYFIIKRIGSIDSELTVTIEFQGTSRNGLDFEFIEQKITFAIGETEKIIPLKIIQDSLSEIQEIVEINLVSGDNYQIDDENYGTFFYVEELLEDNLNSEDRNISNLEIFRGWNLISIDTNLSEIPDEVALVWQFENNSWHGYSSDSKLSDKLIAQNSNLIKNSISHELGTWFLSTKDINITVEPLDVTEQTLQIESPDYGWILLGTKTTIPTSSVTCKYGTVNSIWKYNTKKGWFVYDPLVAVGVIENSFNTLFANEGFWLNCQ
jgi:hypothetical protein